MHPPSYIEFIEAESRAAAQRRQPLRVLLIFLAVFFALQYAWEMSRDSWVERLFIDELTVRPAAWMIDLLWPAFQVHAEGHRLAAAAGRLNILNGCEGMETLFLLAAAFIAYPFGWRTRVLGLGVGTVLVFALNQARIIVLWHAFLHDRTWFGVLHGTVLPVLLVASCLIFFLLFLRRAP
ncbi:MAG: archaeosortase/exosortase family protein [Thiobacillus sp.]|nr:archaeosortase/exosortase family protein [Thiobacillus sp.]